MVDTSDISFQCRAATDKEKLLIAQSLLAHTEAAIGKKVTHEAFSLMAYDNQKLVGGIVGKIFSNWMHFDLVWVDEAYRGKGVGRELLERSYRKAQEADLSGIEVWTQSWQAPEFYRKQGYEELVAFDDFFPGHKRHILRRYVTAASS